MLLFAQLDNAVATLLFSDHGNYLATASLSCHTDNGQDHKNKSQIILEECLANVVTQAVTEGREKVFSWVFPADCEIISVN